MTSVLSSLCTNCELNNNLRIIAVIRSLAVLLAVVLVVYVEAHNLSRSQTSALVLRLSPPTCEPFVPNTNVLLNTPWPLTIQVLNSAEHIAPTWHPGHIHSMIQFDWLKQFQCTSRQWSLRGSQFSCSHPCYPKQVKSLLPNSVQSKAEWLKCTYNTFTTYEWSLASFPVPHLPPSFFIACSMGMVSSCRHSSPTSPLGLPWYIVCRYVMT